MTMRTNNMQWLLNSHTASLLLKPVRRSGCQHLSSYGLSRFGSPISCQSIVHLGSLHSGSFAHGCRLLMHQSSITFSLASKAASYEIAYCKCCQGNLCSMRSCSPCGLPVLASSHRTHASNKGTKLFAVLVAKKQEVASGKQKPWMLVPCSRWNRCVL